MSVFASDMWLPRGKASHLPRPFVRGDRPTPPTIMKTLRVEKSPPHPLDSLQSRFTDCIRKEPL